MASSVLAKLRSRAGNRAEAPEPAPKRAPKTGEEARYQTIVFLGAVIPVLKPIVAAKPELARGFAHRTAVVQISALTPDGVSVDGRAPRLATHLVIDDGELGVKLGPHAAPNVEIEFSSPTKLNAFFTGGVALPRIRGLAGNVPVLVATVRSLLAMASLLGASEPLDDPREQALLTQCMFYLLTSGISQLNRAGHPRLRKWSGWQPDRVYQLKVDGDPELAAFVRVKAGRTRSARGLYTRSRPFFAMAFDSPRSALGILLDVDDMIESTVASKIVMQGAPEYGAELGELMQLVGDYAK